ASAGDAREYYPRMLFETLLESSPDAIVVTDQDGRITGANAQLEKLFGYHRAELLGQPVESLVPERFRGAHPSHRKNFHAEPRMRPMGVGVELYGQRKDGSEFPVDIMLSPVETAEGRAVFSVIYDISEKKLAQEALRKSEQQLRSLVESVRDYAILLLDPEGSVSTWNAGAERITGYAAEEIIGRHFSCFYTAEDIERGRPEEGLRVAVSKGRFEDESWRIRKDGSRFWANVVITAIRDSNGQLSGFAKVTQDLTERKRAEEALLSELSHVLLSNLEIGTLLSAVSAAIRQVVPHDFSSLALHDSETDEFRLQLFDAAYGKDLVTKEIPVPAEGSPLGWVFRSREPLVLAQLDSGRFKRETLQYFLAAGLKSACWLPLVSRDRVLGVLAVASRREAAFTENDAYALGQIASRVGIAVDNALAFRQIAELRDRLNQEKHYLEEELHTNNSFGEIVGKTHQLKSVLKLVETVAPTDATVLILGETGTGKELIARAIHQLSARRERTFVKLNCAAIPSGLLESELFGHEKGAFTGAITQKIGRLELAHRGTLFLDEVGDLPLELQPKLLRALQEKEFERLGSTRTIPVDVRLVVATNRDLGKMVAERQFRSDLYYRLKVFPITTPPLRERAEDIPLLVRHFVDKHARRMNRQIETIPSEAMHAFTRWHWPGNVRELENFIERAVILSPGSVLRAPLAELQVPEDEVKATEEPTLAAAEREHILRVLRETDGVLGGPHGAAARLGLKRTTLITKMKKLGIERPV
ncbi:MAG: sigma 54-interacting transcriptional regulator, partial [Candidatus Acidiferrum sp.]